MTRFDDLDRALSGYLDAEAAAPAPHGLLESAMSVTERRRPRPAWLARLRAGSVSAPRGETARTLMIAAALVALLLAIVGFAVIGGSQRTNPLLTDTRSVEPSAPPSVASVAPVAGGPLDEALRATWLANTDELPLLGTGAGPVSMIISGSGTSLSASNFAPGAAFDSTIADLGDGKMQLTLDRPSGRCEAGAIGTYNVRQSDDGALLDLTPVSDACATRAEAIGRTWGRSLLGATSRGAGFVDSMDPPFSIALPDQALSARTLDDFVEIGGENGFSLGVFKNPQGFADPCSTTRERRPYSPGADSYADFLEHSPVLDTLSREVVTVAGHRAVHIVTIGKTEGAPCDPPPLGYYIWTPKACDCYFVTGPDTKDSQYLIEIGDDTYLFIVAPPDAGGQREQAIYDSLRIPAELPSG